MPQPNNHSAASVDVTTNTSSLAASSHALTRLRNPMVQHVVTSSLPTTVPQSLLISADPMASLRIFAEAERAKTRGQTSSQKVSWTSAWSRFPTSALAQSAQVHASANHTNDRKRPRPPTAEFGTALVSVESSTSQAARLPLRKRRKNIPNRNPFYPSCNQSPTPSILSLSSTVSTGDTTDSDVHDHTEDEDRDENNEYLVPAYPCLPPTPLTPHDVLQSTTLSRMFSRANRTFHQIANSATGLVEADQSTFNRMGELVEVLRGDLGGRRWFEVVERAFLSPTSKAVLSNSATRNGKGPTSSISQKPPYNESAAIPGKETSSHALPGRRRIQSMEQSGLDARAHRGFGGSSDATNHLESGSDSHNESRRLMLDPRYQILTQAPGFIQSLFVSSDPVTVPVMYHPPSDVRGIHSSQQTQPSELNTSQKINGASTGSNTKSHPASVVSGNGALENLSIQQQIDSYHDCTIEISKFLGDLSDYRDRLLEVRDGCLSVDKRRRALWAIVKVCANGYDEICNGQNSNTVTESSAVAASTMDSKQEPDGTVHTIQSTAPSRTNGHTGSPSLRGKSRAR